MTARVKAMVLPKTLLPPTKEYHGKNPEWVEHPRYVPLSKEQYKKSTEIGRKIAIRNRTSTKHWTEEEVQRAVEMRKAGAKWRVIGEKFGVTDGAARHRIQKEM